jgi:hypothetical protein
VGQDGPGLGRRDRNGAADARGPFGLGQLSGLLTRRQAGRVRIVRRDRPGLGRRDGSGAVDAQGPFGLGQLSGLLRRRQGGAGFICGK